ncbi:MAG: hypothetical protein WB565_10020 [Acidimicrobiales bacterium]
MGAEPLGVSEAGVDPGPPKGRRWKRITSWSLLVLACLLAVLSVVVVFARNQLLNTDAYVNTMAPLASDPVIQTQIATRVSQELIARTDLNQQLKDALPQKADFLVTPVASEVKNAAYSITLKAVQSPQFEKLWVGLNRTAHKQLVNVLTGSTQGAVSTSNGKVTIDLSQVEQTAKKDLDAKGITVFDKVPAVKALNYVLFQSEDLVKIQGLVNFLDKLAIALPIVALLLFAVSIVLSHNRRRGLVRAATGLALSMAIVLVATALVRNQYLSGVRPPSSPEAQAVVLDTVTATLRNTLRLILLLAAITAIVGVLAGNRWVRTKLSSRQMPSWMTGGPTHDFVARHRKALQWVVLTIGLLVLVIWNNPTTLVAVVVVVITLAAVGLVGLWAGRSYRPTASSPKPSD